VKNEPNKAPEPTTKKGGIFGVQAKEHDRYMARIRQLVQSLTECDSCD